MADRVNGVPCEHVGIWTSVGVNDNKYVVKKDARNLPNPLEDGNGRDALREFSREKGKEILEKAESSPFR